MPAQVNPITVVLYGQTEAEALRDTELLLSVGCQEDKVPASSPGYATNSIYCG